ncbi:hypothetical protein [Rathayibacter tanaceti]|uniref:Uncharacterized protein n=2 Tax=Rathayibacter tanaceti TaxID=1671680 RepID=A0A166H003_9MICO|nr:hypothetical protein [Rathayibacter tanaceti]KZX19688.1 hypothetical protein ACH61_03216 [Rathayibacter tanaceti]QHC54445.1 hypothetical protein GSU10_01385 [Rathayibacter tanaceti]TCO35071.1 hypothetical protein EV639_10975 [Rathayibacter tanaceti]
MVQADDSGAQNAGTAGRTPVEEAARRGNWIAGGLFLVAGMCFAGAGTAIWPAFLALGIVFLGMAGTASRREEKPRPESERADSAP